MPSTLDLTGLRVGRWTVLSRAETVNNRTFWNCLCDCGTNTPVTTDSLRRQASKSCGCLKIDLAKVRMRETMTVHGQSKTPIYGVWRTMIERCECPKNHKYSRYGGRGIRVCDRWKDFEFFVSDMGPKPGPHHTIDRKNNDGHYEPDNCRWATQREQQNNRGDNRLLTVNGETKTSAQWARQLGLNPNTVRQRIDRDGMSHAMALGMPSKKVVGGTRRRYDDLADVEREEDTMSEIGTR